jgi:hypothetical protein
MHNAGTAHQQKVRTTLHLSPSLVAVAMLSAQRAGLRLHEWLDRAVAHACAGSEEADDAMPTTPWADATVELFACIASTAPEVLTGRWRVLYTRVCVEDELWDYPRMTVGEIEDGAVLPPPTLNIDRLRRAWPRLVAACFVQ